MPSDYELNASAAAITSQKQEYPPTQQNRTREGCKKTHLHHSACDERPHHLLTQGGARKRAPSH